MVETEFFHNLEQYLESGIAPFIEHAQDYVDGKKTIPVSKITTNDKREITLTFSDELLTKFVKGNTRLKKDYEMAIKYGFRGYSLGGKNGIFFQNKTNKNLNQTTDRLVSLYLENVLENLALPSEDQKSLDSLKKIKVVSHDPSGKRLIGVYNIQNQRMLLLDYAYY